MEFEIIKTHIDETVGQNGSYISSDIMKKNIISEVNGCPTAVVQDVVFKDCLVLDHNAEVLKSHKLIDKHL